MSEVITTLTGFEIKPGESSGGAFVLTKFLADDGKKYQTFDEELADLAKSRLGKKSLITFEVQSRQNQNRTFVNNVMTGIADPEAVVSGEAVGAQPRGARPITPHTRVVAFAAGERVVRTLFEAGQMTTYDFSDISRVADNILAWAEGSLAGSDPEDAIPDADPADAVPN